MRSKKKEDRTAFIESQRELREKQQQIHQLENDRNNIQLDFVRYEERQRNLGREMDEAIKAKAVAVRSTRPNPYAETEVIYPDIQRLRYKLELIGGIDPEIVKEYEDTKTRFEFLDTQITDLRNAIESTEKIVKELDEDIHTQSKKVFAQIQKEFERYFKILFNGGSCALVKLSRDDLKEDEEEIGVTPERVFEDTGDAEREKSDKIRERIEKYDDGVVGIEIQATPPGKKTQILKPLIRRRARPHIHRPALRHHVR